MNIKLGKEGKENSWQEKFPEEANCECGGRGRMAFVMIEEVGDDEYVCSLYENKEGSFWPHDVIAIAVYFCKNCRKAIIFWNQA